jgi:hypothetical protein
MPAVDASYDILLLAASSSSSSLSYEAKQNVQFPSTMRAIRSDPTITRAPYEFLLAAVDELGLVAAAAEHDLLAAAPGRWPIRFIIMMWP